MRIFKGFFVPPPDNLNQSRQEQESGNIKQQFCLKAISQYDPSGCGTIFKSTCNICLFFMASEKLHNAAFWEWYEARGKVQYDRES